MPDEYNKNDNSFPLLLFLHGLGEKGENLELVTRFGPPNLIKKGTWPKDLPFVVISPQLPVKYKNWSTDIIDDILDEVLAKYRIDSHKIYLTGLSLGGIGTWNYALHHPEKLAAIIPVCGKGNPALACNFGNLPVWAFHGALDKLVVPEGSIKMIDALKNCTDRTSTAENTKLTIYPDIRHDSWKPTYINTDIYKWLLQFENQSFNPPSHAFDTLVNNNNSESNTFALKELCKLPLSLKEISGLEYNNNGLIWAHNDSGGLPFIYQMDTLGKIHQIKKITNATNYDWEDIAKDEDGNLYIGDFGNNKNNRKTLQIYKISNPEDIDEERIKAEIIEYAYPDQGSFPPPAPQLNFDVEAMIAFNDNLYIFTKNRTLPFSGYVKLYKLPTQAGKYTAELLDSVFLDNKNMLTDWITGAAISPNKKTIALLTSDKIWLLRGFKGDDFLKGDKLPVHLPFLSQKEGVCFTNNTEVLICDELFRNVIGGKLYSLDLSSFILD